MSVNQSYLDDVTRVCRACRSVLPFLHTISAVWMGCVSAMSVNQSRLGMTPHRPNNISIGSVIFTHHAGNSIGLTSVQPFLRMSALFNRPIQHVWVVAVLTMCLWINRIWMTSHESAEHLNRFSRFCTNQLICCWAIEIFLFFNIAAVRHLRFVWDIFGPSLVVSITAKNFVMIDSVVLLPQLRSWVMSRRYCHYNACI